MSLPGYATSQDVQARLGEQLDADGLALADSLLADTLVLIRSRVGMFDEKVATGAISREAVVMVQCNAVIRVLRNPEGFRSEQEGDYLYSRDAVMASGQLRLLPDEWALVGVRKSFTVQPAFGPAYEVHPNENLTINDIAFRFGLDHYGY